MGIFEGCGVSPSDEEEKPKKKKSRSGLSDRTIGGRAGMMDDIFGDEYPQPATTPARKKKK